MRMRWLRVVPVFLLACAAMFGTGTALAQDASPAAGGSPLEQAVAWLESQQAADGGFVGYTGESDAGFTLDALIALGAARNAGVDTSASIDAALAFLGESDHALVYAQTGVGQSAKLILGLTAVGVEPEGFANVMPLTILQAGQAEGTGIFGTGMYDHALTIMALVVMGEEVPDSAIEALATTQAANGGWAWDGSTDEANADSNTTSMVVQALVAAGLGDHDLVNSATAFLETTWTNDGGLYSPAEGTAPDANSSALVLQATVALGGDANSMLPGLAAFQNSTGAFFFNTDDTSDNAYATVQVIPALATQAFPILPSGSDTPAATPANGNPHGAA